MLIILCAIATPASDAKSILRTSAVFFGTNALSGGIITGIFSWTEKYFLWGGGIYADVSLAELISIILIIVAVSVPFFIKTGNRITVKSASVFITFHGHSTHFDALIDSGNLLTDPISGDGIILIKHSKLKEIFSVQQLSAIKKLDVLSESFPTGIRLISTDNGLIPVFRPQNAEVKIFGDKEKREISVLVGIDFSGGSFGGAWGLIPSQYVL